MTLKSLLPQSILYDRKEIPFSFGNIIYGILSYDGPLVVICDFEKKQIVKGLFVRKENAKGKEQAILKINEVLIEACPRKVIIYDDPLQIETKFEIEWMAFTGKSFVIGPSSITEMISILKLKALVLNANLLENALISIFRSLVESGKAEFKDAKDMSNSNMDIRKWIDNSPV